MRITKGFSMNNSLKLILFVTVLLGSPACIHATKACFYNKTGVSGMPTAIKIDHVEWALPCKDDHNVANLGAGNFKCLTWIGGCTLQKVGFSIAGQSYEYEYDMVKVPNGGVLDYEIYWENSKPLIKAEVYKRVNKKEVVLVVKEKEAQGQSIPETTQAGSK